jgi:hypothetical protein
MAVNPTQQIKKNRPPNSSTIPRRLEGNSSIHKIKLKLHSSVKKNIFDLTFSISENNITFAQI